MKFGRMSCGTCISLIYWSGWEPKALITVLEKLLVSTAWTLRSRQFCGVVELVKLGRENPIVAGLAADTSRNCSSTSLTFGKCEERRYFRASYFTQS